MPHRANQSFFDVKKEWSKRKDLILSNYLTPYLAKVSTLSKPILIVDGFAGAGDYLSGESGSPVIIAGAVARALARPKVPITVLCIEEDDALRRRLETALTGFTFTSVRGGTFLEHVPEIESLAASCTTFLYLDPYAIEGLEWDALTRVFKYLRENKSIEILLNFSAASFVRRALAALAMSAPDDGDDDSDGSAEPPSMARLNTAVGGDWWRPIVQRNTSFAKKVQAVAAGYCDQLRQHFREVCEHAIHAKWDDAVPKYSLIFGSRSPDALILMNDATIKSRNILATQAKPLENTLFETRPQSLVPDVSHLPAAIVASLNTRMTRKELTSKMIRAHFCVYTEAEIHRGVSALLKARRLHSATGKTRINDEVEIWRT